VNAGSGVSGVSTRTLLACGVAGPIVFVAGFVVLGAIRPGYDPMRQFVSLLELADGGWAMTIVFLASGLLVLASAVGLRRSLAPGIGARWVPVGVGIAGIGLLLAGVFSTDPLQGYPPGTPLEAPLEYSWHAFVHVAGALLFFLGIPIAALVMARRFEVERRIGWAVGSVACAVVMLIANAATSTSPGSVGTFPEINGLLQRVSLIAGLGWLAAVSADQLRQGSRSSAVVAGR